MTTLHSGLVSITFRQLSPGEIIDLAARAGLEAIEWGGDVHVPHGELAAAREVRRATEDAGLRVCAYGSYYRVGHDEPAPFGAVLATARALGAPVVRVWAGKRGSAEAGGDYRRRVADAARDICEQAHPAGIRVAFEYHASTLTDTLDSALGLLAAVDHPNLGCYWQKPRGASVERALGELRGVLPWLVNLHVFHWDTGGNRLALDGGGREWRRYLRLAESTGRSHHALIEFVADNSPEAFARDAATLRAWLDAAAPAGNRG